MAHFCRTRGPCSDSSKILPSTLGYPRPPHWKGSSTTEIGSRIPSSRISYPLGAVLHLKGTWILTVPKLHKSWISNKVNIVELCFHFDTLKYSLLKTRGPVPNAKMCHESLWINKYYCFPDCKVLNISQLRISLPNVVNHTAKQL